MPLYVAFRLKYSNMQVHTHSYDVIYLRIFMGLEIHVRAQLLYVDDIFEKYERSHEKPYSYNWQVCLKLEVLQSC